MWIAFLRPIGRGSDPVPAAAVPRARGARPGLSRDDAQSAPRRIHSLAKSIGQHSPEHLAWCADIRAVPFKKTPTPAMAYLDKPEVDALLRTPDRRTGQSARNHALLLFLYNTGARVDEAAHVTVADLIHGASPAVRLVARARRPESVRSGP